MTDGQRVVLLADRGWTETRRGPVATAGQPTEGQRLLDAIAEIKQTAREVVGPDEPSPGSSSEEAKAQYWAAIARGVQQRGVNVTPSDLELLPHDVELSDRALDRIGLG